MADTPLRASSAHAKPRLSLEERAAAFRLCGAHPLAGNIPPRGIPDEQLRQAFALTCLMSAAIESEEVRLLNTQILVASLDAISDLIARATFAMEDAGNG